MSVSGEAAVDVCPLPPIASEVRPDPDLASLYEGRRRLHRDALAGLREPMHELLER
jgi:hypothetical protein